MKWDNSRFEKNKWIQSCLKYKKFALASDYIRLWVLYNYGGIYLDTDMICYGSLDKYLDTDFLIGWENDNAILSFGLIGTKIKSPYIKEIMNWYEDKEYDPSMENFPYELEDINKNKFKVGGAITINKIGTKILMSHIQNGEIKPYNNEYFVAGHYAPNSGYRKTENTIFQHIYGQIKTEYKLKDFNFIN
jgi:mannosyltransferase OCH1-like enzyme